MDDERSVRDACREIATSLGYHASAAESAEQALRLTESQTIDVVFLDLKLPGTGGLEAMRQIKARRPEIEVIVVTGHGTVESAVQAMKSGAYDYVTKPFSMAELKLLLGRVSTHLKLKTENRVLREKIKSKQGFGSIIGRAPEMDRLYRIIAKAAHSVHPVLILGESGTGKEMVARAIHHSGPFRDKPFIPVDCGSLVPTLIESELFGYVKGAFTGAVQAKEGLLAIADGGTVFLDEVGELPVDLQAKMLRALQEKEIRPVGSTKHVSINVRILAATNRDLDQRGIRWIVSARSLLSLECAEPAHPAAARAAAGYSAVGNQFSGTASQASGQARELSDDAMKALMAYDWPGNVRELENCLERCCAMTFGRHHQCGRFAERDHRIVAAADHGDAREPNPAHGRTREADHPDHYRAVGRRQADGGEAARHWQDDALSQIERIRRRVVARSGVGFPDRTSRRSRRAAA